jgi:hypothetical protein
METNDLLPMVFERFSAAQTLWNLYITVSLGLLMFIAAVPVALNRRAARMVLSVAFVVFAASNLGALREVTNQRIALVNLTISKLGDTEKGFITPNILNAPPVWVVAVFHLFWDAMVLICIWFLHKYFKK